MMNGASGAVRYICDDEPMCMLMTVPVSLHAAKNGSQWRLWSCTDGKLSFAGFSENDTAKLPLAAQRRISSAARPGSHNGIIVSGINRPDASPAHHSSIIQSL